MWKVARVSVSAQGGALGKQVQQRGSSESARDEMLLSESVSGAQGTSSE